MPPEIPQEIVDNIIDHLHDDAPTLIVTSMVSKSWMYSSRFHLFRYIEIDDDPEGLDCIQFLETSPNVCHHVWDLYLEFRGEVMVEIITRLLTCLGNLRSFVIEGQVSQLKSGTMPFPLYHIDFLGIHFMLAGTAELEDPEGPAERVDEEDGGEIVPDDEVAPNHEGNGGGVWEVAEPTELMRDNPPEGAINVLRLFSLWHIGELFVTFPNEFSHHVGEADEFPEVGPSTMHVNTLGIVNDPGDGLLFRLLRHCLHPTSLRTLTASSNRGFVLQDITFSELLVVLPNLTDLRVGCGMQSTKDVKISFLECRALQSLRLDVSFYLVSTLEDGTLTWYGTINWATAKRILDMRICHLTSLFIRFLTPLEASPAIILKTFESMKSEWEALDQCIDHFYPNLQSLTIQFDYPDPKDAISDTDLSRYLRELLPRMVARGILCFRRPLPENYIPERRDDDFPNLIELLFVRD